MEVIEAQMAQTGTTTPSPTSTLGILWAIYGILRVLAAAFLLLYSGTLTLMWGALLNRVPDPFSWMTLFHFVWAGAVALAIFSALFSFLAALALLGRTGSAPRLAVIAAFLGLISGPLGIALGVPTLIIFLRRPAV
jgi:hypothetical protein